MTGKPLIGVIGSPQLAAAIQQAGWAEVASGNTQQDAVANVLAATKRRPTEMNAVVVMQDPLRDLPHQMVVSHMRPAKLVVLVDPQDPQLPQLVANREFVTIQTPASMTLLFGTFGVPTPEGADDYMIDSQGLVYSDNQTGSPEPIATGQWQDESAARRLATADSVQTVGSSNPVSTTTTEDFLSGAGRRRHTRTGRGAVVFVSSIHRGGPGKSTTAKAIGNRAAQLNLRTVWVEGAMQQQSAQEHFGLDSTRFFELPSIFDYHLNRQVSEAVVSPEDLQQHRSQTKFPGFGFGVVMAPSKEEMDRGLVSAATYVELISKLRNQVDLVVVDCYQFDNSDPLGMLDKLIAPMVRDDPNSWLVLVCNMDRIVMKHTQQWVNEATSPQGFGIEKTKIMTLMNDIPADDSTIDSQIPTMVNGLESVSHFLGVVWRSNEVLISNNSAIPLGDHDAFLYPIDELMFHVFGFENTSQKWHPNAKPEPKNILRRLFSRR